MTSSLLQKINNFSFKLPLLKGFVQKFKVSVPFFIPVAFFVTYTMIGEKKGLWTPTITNLYLLWYVTIVVSTNNLFNNDMKVIYFYNFYTFTQFISLDYCYTTPKLIKDIYFMFGNYLARK